MTRHTLHSVSLILNLLTQANPAISFSRMTNYFQNIRANWRFIFAVCYPIALLSVPLVNQSLAGRYLYSLGLIAGFWLTEAIPSPVTGLLPIFLHPILGIQTSNEVVPEYMKDSSLVSLGGFLVALAFEYCGLHKRIALKVMIWSGTSLATLLLGIMLTTMFLSMWMFNTATASMMVPIVLAVLEELQGVRSSEIARVSISEPIETNCQDITEDSNEDDAIRNKNANLKGSTGKADKMSKKMHRLRTLFLLGICYSSNLGGTGVLTGTGANLIAIDFLGNLDPLKHGDNAALTFTTWSAFAVVPMTLNVFAAWFYLQLVFIGIPERLKFWKKKETVDSAVSSSNKNIEEKIRNTLVQKYESLGPISTHEIAVSIHFLVSVTLWSFHNPRIIPGWSELFVKRIHISTGTIMMGVILFVIPRNREFYYGLRTWKFSSTFSSGLLDWRFAESRIPWGVFTLLGGGHALSKGAKISGVAAMLGDSLYLFASLPVLAIQITILLLIVFLTEIVSNSAISALAIPILLDLSVRLGIHPLYLTFPSAIACSYSFMLPVATGPNAVVYASSDLKLGDMIKVGFFMNFIAVAVLFACINLYGNLIFHFSDYVPFQLLSTSQLSS